MTSAEAARDGSGTSHDTGTGRSRLEAGRMTDLFVSAAQPAPTQRRRLPRRDDVVFGLKVVWAVGSLQDCRCCIMQNVYAAVEETSDGGIGLDGRKRH